MVGRLYTPDDNRKDSAFTIFYMGVNVGSTLAPLVCGLVGNTGHPEDFKWGFLAACIGMILGATVFQIFKNKYICDPDGNPVGVAPQRSASTEKQSETSSQKSTSRTLLMLGSTLLLTLLFSINWNADSAHLFAGADWIGSLIYATTIVMPVIIITDHSLSRHEKLRIGVIYIIAFSLSSSGLPTNRPVLHSPSLPTNRPTATSEDGKCQLPTSSHSTLS